MKIYLFVLFFVWSCIENNKPGLTRPDSINGLEISKDIVYHEKFYYIRCTDNSKDMCDQICPVLNNNKCSSVLNNFPSNLKFEKKCIFSNKSDFSDNDLKVVFSTNGKISYFSTINQSHEENEILEKLILQFSGVHKISRLERIKTSIGPEGFGNKIIETNTHVNRNILQAGSSIFFTYNTSEYADRPSGMNGVFINYLSDGSYV